VNGPERTAIWSDESGGVIADGATAGIPAVDGTDHSDETRATVVRWRNAVPGSNYGDADDETDMDDVEPTWSMVTTAVTICYSVDEHGSGSDENRAALYVRMAVETQVAVHTMDGIVIKETCSYPAETSFYEIVVRDDY